MIALSNSTSAVLKKLFIILTMMKILFLDTFILSDSKFHAHHQFIFCCVSNWYCNALLQEPLPPKQ